MLLCAFLAAAPAMGQEKSAESGAKGAGKSVKTVKFGKLWDGKGKVWTNAIVIVEGERVKEVTTDLRRVPPGAET